LAQPSGPLDVALPAVCASERRKAKEFNSAKALEVKEAAALDAEPTLPSESATRHVTISCTSPGAERTTTPPSRTEEVEA
jgi:hypothetical protein